MVSNSGEGREAKISMIRRLAREHPDWSRTRIQKAVRKQLGSSIRDSEAIRIIAVARKPRRKTGKKPAVTHTEQEIQAAVRVAEGLALLHPDWSRSQINKEQQKVTGIKLSSQQLSLALKARKEQERAVKERETRKIRQQKEHARHLSLNRAQELAKEHPDWGRRKIAQQLKAEGLPGLRTSVLGEAIRRARGLKKKPSKYEVYFAAEGVKKDESPWIAFYSSKLFRKTKWRYNSLRTIKDYKYFINRLNREINQRYGYRGIHTIYDFPEWSFTYYITQLNPATGNRDVKYEVTGSNRRGIRRHRRGVLT